MRPRKVSSQWVMRGRMRSPLADANRHRGALLKIATGNTPSIRPPSGASSTDPYRRLNNREDDKSLRRASLTSRRRIEAPEVEWQVSTTHLEHINRDNSKSEPMMALRRLQATAAASRDEAESMMGYVMKQEQKLVEQQRRTTAPKIKAEPRLSRLRKEAAASWWQPLSLMTSAGHRNYMTMMMMMIMLIGGGFIRASEAVDCFKCSSRNGSNPACEDPFHNLNTTRIMSPVLPDPQPHVIYHTPCYAGKKGKEGLFPASACIKLTGTFDATGETLVVRHCALDSGTLTQDTELARMSHCGKFQFEGDLLRGCVLACPEDACNVAIKLADPSRSVLIVALLVSLRLAHRNLLGL